MAGAEEIWGHRVVLCNGYQPRLRKGKEL